MLKERLFRSAAAALTFATALMLLAGCQKKEAPAPVQAPPVEVKVTASRSETVPVVNEFVGRVAAYRSVEVRARVEGILEKRHFVEGTEVKRGDVLYSIDPTPYRIALNDAQAEQARAQANLGSARSREARLAPLVKENAISRQDYDDAVTAVKQNEALLAVAAANIERRSQPRLHASHGHRVGPHRCHAGARRAARRQGRGHALATIDRIDPVYVNFNIADRDALILRRELSRGTVTAGEGSSQARAVTCPMAASTNAPASSTSPRPRSTPVPARSRCGR